MLAGLHARLAADPRLAARIEPAEGQAEALPFADAAFDALTFTYLLRYVDDPAATLRELARVVRPGGTSDGRVRRAAAPPAARAVADLHAPRPAALGRLLSRDWQEVGRFLGPSIEGFYAHAPAPGARRAVGGGRPRGRARARG